MEKSDPERKNQKGSWGQKCSDLPVPTYIYKLKSNFFLFFFFGKKNVKKLRRMFSIRKKNTKKKLKKKTANKLPHKNKKQGLLLSPT